MKVNTVVHLEQKHNLQQSLKAQPFIIVNEHDRDASEAASCPLKIFMFQLVGTCKGLLMSFLL